MILKNNTNSTHLKIHEDRQTYLFIYFYLFMVYQKVWGGGQYIKLSPPPHPTLKSGGVMFPLSPTDQRPCKNQFLYSWELTSNHKK